VVVAPVESDAASLLEGPSGVVTGHSMSASVIRYTPATCYSRFNLVSERSHTAQKELAQTANRS